MPPSRRGAMRRRVEGAQPAIGRHGEQRDVVSQLTRFQPGLQRPRRRVFLVSRATNANSRRASQMVRRDQLLRSAMVSSTMYVDPNAVGVGW